MLSAGSAHIRQRRQRRRYNVDRRRPFFMMIFDIHPLPFPVFLWLLLLWNLYSRRRGSSVRMASGSSVFLLSFSLLLLHSFLHVLFPLFYFFFFPSYNSYYLLFWAVSPRLKTVRIFTSAGGWKSPEMISKQPWSANGCWFSCVNFPSTRLVSFFRWFRRFQ